MSLFMRLGRRMTTTREEFHTDQQYVRECLNGHPDQYRHLARRYERVLLSHLLPQCRDRGDAEEAAQETLVRAYFWLPSLKKRGSFFSWLIGIADRVVQEQRRARQRDRRIEEAAKAQAMSDSQAAPSPSNDAPLARAINAPPQEYRQLILMRYYSDLSCKEVSDLFDMPLGTVTKMLSRAYVMLRESLTQENE